MAESALWSFVTADRVVFGRGALSLLGDIGRRVGRRVVLCTDRALADAGLVKRAEDVLRRAGLDVFTFDGGQPEVKREVIERCAEWAREIGPDAVIGLGGGSNLDLAKATALLLRHGGPINQYYGEAKVPGPITPVIAVPTTAGTGSEVTPVAVLSDDAAILKVGISSHHLVPRWAVVDPLLTLSCPSSVTAHAGMDALSHAIEAYVAVGYGDRTDGFNLDRVFVGKNPLSDALALEAIRLISFHLERAYRAPDEVDAREAMLLGSLMAGMAFASAGTGIVHALQYPIGARTGTAHGLGNALLLPAAMRFNQSVRTAELAAIGRAMGIDAKDCAEHDMADAAIAKVRDLATSVGIPANLQAIGVRPSDIVELAEMAYGVERLIRNNPRPVDVAALVSVLCDALGEPEAEPAPHI